MATPQQQPTKTRPHIWRMVGCIKDELMRPLAHYCIIANKPKKGLAFCFGAKPAPETKAWPTDSRQTPPYYSYRHSRLITENKRNNWTTHVHYSTVHSRVVLYKPHPRVIVKNKTTKKQTCYRRQDTRQSNTIKSIRRFISEKNPPNKQQQDHINVCFYQRCEGAKLQLRGCYIGGEPKRDTMGPWIGTTTPGYLNRSFVPFFVPLTTQPPASTLYPSSQKPPKKATNRRAAGFYRTAFLSYHKS